MINTNEEYEEALLKIETLFEKNSDTLDKLISDVIDYEHRHYPVEEPSLIEKIKFRIDQQQIDFENLIEEINNENNKSEGLKGEKKLSPEMLSLVAKKLGIF